jgi:hypothetical protein
VEIDRLLAAAERALADATLNGIATERIRVLDAYRAARNLADYRGVPVSDAVAEECAADARRVLVAVRAWIAAHRADLV